MGRSPRGRRRRYSVPVMFGVKSLVLLLLGYFVVVISGVPVLLIRTSPTSSTSSHLTSRISLLEPHESYHDHDHPPLVRSKRNDPGIINSGSPPSSVVSLIEKPVLAAAAAASSVVPRGLFSPVMTKTPVPGSLNPVVKNTGTGRSVLLEAGSSSSSSLGGSIATGSGVSKHHAYRSVKKLDYSHPYRKKVKPVEKPITPYFVRILRRRPVGPSAMNHTVGPEAFESSDKGELIDVPRVLVDKRRNKNVDIHPIYVVEEDDDDGDKDDGGDDRDSQEEEEERGGGPDDEDVVFVPTRTAIPSTTTTTTTTTTEVPIRTTPPTPSRKSVIPIVRLSRVEQQERDGAPGAGGAGLGVVVPTAEDIVTRQMRVMGEERGGSGIANVTTTTNKPGHDNSGGERVRVTPEDHQHHHGNLHAYNLPNDDYVLPGGGGGNGSTGEGQHINQQQQHPDYLPLDYEYEGQQDNGRNSSRIYTFPGGSGVLLPPTPPEVLTLGGNDDGGSERFHFDGDRDGRGRGLTIGAGHEGSFSVLPPPPREDEAADDEDDDEEEEDDDDNPSRYRVTTKKRVLEGHHVPETVVLSVEDGGGDGSTGKGVKAGGIVASHPTGVRSDDDSLSATTTTTTTTSTPPPPPPPPPPAPTSMFGDYGYGGVVIGGDLHGQDLRAVKGADLGRREEEKKVVVSTLSTTTSTTTTTTTPKPTTTTTTSTTPEPTTTTTTTTTSTTPKPTTTTTTTTSTTPEPTTTTTTTTSTTPKPTTTTTTTTPPPPPPPRFSTPSPEEEIDQILNTIPPGDEDPDLTPEQRQTIQQLLLAHILGASSSAASTPQPPPSLHTASSLDGSVHLPKFTPFPDDIYSATSNDHNHLVGLSSPAASSSDLQTSASTTTAQFFSTRADTSAPATSTRNPLLSFLETLSSTHQQQRSTSAPAPTTLQLTQPQQQVVSFVRPIQETPAARAVIERQEPQQQVHQQQNIGGGGGGGDTGVNIMRMLIQLPGNLLVGMLRFMRSTGEFLGGLMSGVMKMLSGLAGGSSSGGGVGAAAGGLFGG